MFKILLLVKDLSMIKSKLKVKISKNYEMEITKKLVMPSVVKEKDIYSLFSGLLMMIKDFSKKEAEKQMIHNDLSYNHLLKMYLNSLEKMNRYKAILKENKIEIC